MNVERSRVYAYFMFVVEAMLRYVTFRLSSRDVSSQAFLVSSPDPTHYVRKGLVTFEGFLGCAHPHVLIQQARDLHVRTHFVYKIFIVSACREPVYVCVASLFSVLLINCQRSQISRSDQGRSDNGVYYACANAYL